MELASAFACVGDSVEELNTYLGSGHALEEQTARISTTHLKLSEDGSRIDGYITTSVTSWQLSSRYRERHGIRRRFVPTILIGYVAAHREAPNGTGYWMYRAVVDDATRINRTAAVRLVALEVEAVNLGAYRTYVTRWGMTPMPIVREDGKAIDPPHPEAKRPPDGLPDGARFKLFLDLKLLE